MIESWRENRIEKWNFWNQTDKIFILRISLYLFSDFQLISWFLFVCEREKWKSHFFQFKKKKNGFFIEQPCFQKFFYQCCTSFSQNVFGFPQCNKVKKNKNETRKKKLNNSKKDWDSNMQISNIKKTIWVKYLEKHNLTVFF